MDVLEIGAPEPGAPGLLRRHAGLLCGLAVIAIVTALDLVFAEEHVLISPVMIGAFVAAVLGTPRDTAIVGAVALAAVIASGSWNDTFDEPAYFVRIAIVTAGLAIAMLAARALTRVGESRRRFALLAALAELGDGADTLEGTVDRLTALLVPAFADIALVDVVHQGEARRLGVRVHGPHARELEPWLRQRPPSDASVRLASRNAVESGRTQLVERLTPEMLAGMARDEEDARLMGLAAVHSQMTVPLRARGRMLGALSLSVREHSGRSYGPGDAEFAEVAAGRAALALDNAGLYAELETVEAQLSAALGSLKDAVTVQTPQGRLLYANDAAARAMGFETARDLLARPPAEIVGRYDIFREDGSPMDLTRLPGRLALLGEDPAPTTLRWVERATGAEHWTVVKATAVRDRNGTPIFAVNVMEDVTAARREEIGRRLLARAGEVLASSLDYERTLQQVAELAVPDLADWCGVNLPDREGFLAQVAIAHVDPEKVRMGRELNRRYPVRVDDPTGSAQVLRDGVPQVFNDIPDELLRESARDAEHYELIRSVGMRAAMIVPLLVAGRAIGTLALVRSESARPFDDADRALAEELGRRAGTAVENARLYTERSAIAATLQAGLLPRPLPPMPGWETSALYRPAGSENWVGGDFYDAFRVREGWMLVVGDVAGRGATAAAMTALARHTLRAAAQLLDDPLAAVARLNDELLDHSGGLCTVACALLREADGGRGEATFVCAGHPQPFLVRGGRATQVGEFGPMVGAVEEASWTRATVELEPGDILVLYSDGVIDAVGETERFGEARLGRTLAAAGSAQDAVARIERALAEFEHGEQADDTAVVAIARTPVEAMAAEAGTSATGTPDVSE